MSDVVQKTHSAINRGSTELEWLLDYELCLALRHQRDVSLVLITDNRGDLNLGVLEGLIRRSDELFLFKSDAAILMSETAKSGALKAVERFRKACLGQFDLRFAVATYPGDGRLTGVLLNSVHRRLLRARVSNRAAVVSSD